MPPYVTGFNRDVERAFYEWLRTHPNRMRFTPEKYARVREMLEFPDAPLPAHLVGRERVQYSQDRAMARRDYFLQDDRIYKKFVDPSGIGHEGLLVFLENDVFHRITQTHNRLQHGSMTSLSVY